MSNTLTLSEPQVNTLISTWTGLRLERGPNSTNLGAFSLVVQIPYVIGQTTYTYLDTAGQPSDWYRVARYGPAGLLGSYSPPWPVAPQPITAGSGARRSRKNNRRVLARKLQSLQVVTTTADGADDGSTIESTGLATVLDANRYRSWWAMPTDGVSMGEIRVVANAALNAATGQMTHTPPFLSKIVRGTQVEFHKWLPPDELGGLLGLNQALNLALAECWVLDRLAVAGLGSTITYDLSSFGDWLDPEAIVEFYGPNFSSQIPLVPWGGYMPRRDGELVLMETAPGIANGAAMQVELTRQADTYIKIAGVWTDGQLGFQNDDDECLLQPEFLSEVALAYCYEAIAASLTGVPAARWQKRAEDQRTRVNIAKWRGLPHPGERSDHRAVESGNPQDWLAWLK